MSRTSKTPGYTVVQFLDHLEQALADSIAWHEAAIGKSAEQLEAFRAGFREGATAARRLFALHAGARLTERRLTLDEKRSMVKRAVDNTPTHRRRK